MLTESGSCVEASELPCLKTDIKINICADSVNLTTLTVLPDAYVIRYIWRLVVICVPLVICSKSAYIDKRRKSLDVGLYHRRVAGCFDTFTECDNCIGKLTL